MSRFSYILFISLALLVLTCVDEQAIPVTIDISYAVSNGSYTVPADVTISNNTTGADFYRWTFEGATPTTSNKKQPGTISFSQAGTYIVKLEAWNDFQRSEKEITIQLDSAVTLDFQLDILVNDFVPATVKITNGTEGASSYEWTFEGGNPATSTLANPPNVLFDTPGEHTITLRVGNGREFFSSSQTIFLKPALLPDFEIIPSFEDEDYEAPLMATLQNKTISGIRYTWSSTAGTIQNTSAEHTEISLPSAGEYTVTLTVDNDKETKNIQRTITVKENTNLYVMENITLGISAAHNTIGTLYSPRLRQTILSGDLNAENGPLIDLAFFAINSSFGYSRFISPDSSTKFSFPSIPNAQHTYIINDVETSGLSFTVTDFDAMINDVPIASLPIQAHDSGVAYFASEETPRIVLFETHDGRKGAIKIKSFVSAGLESRIVADIKIQKLKP